MPDFAGFPEAALDFYDDLETENTRSFWTANKATYDTAVRAPMAALVTALEPEFGAAKVFRPYRDVRYAKDKTPYKTHQGGFVPARISTGWYVQLDARGVSVSAGSYAAEPALLARFREAVASASGAGQLTLLLNHLEGTGWQVEGDRLRSSPRGYPRDHPNIELLRHRSLWVTRSYGFALVIHRPELVERVRADWRETRPLVEWLLAHATG
ncbi:MAG: DUF2461 domain-containing protein [Nocardioidaceae bacterium]